MNGKIQKMGDEDILRDILISQKYITILYNTNVNECTDQELKDNMLKILREEHNIQTSVYQDMQKRGWYSTLPVPKQQIQDANTKFQAIGQEL